MRMKVLIAEDDALTRNGLAEVLRSEGYGVVVAEDGQSALEMFESESPDLVCLDIMMPEVNGYDVCRRMRATRPAIPIVFISAKSEETDKVVGLELGADDFIVKPFGVKEVVARIRAVARRCHAPPANAAPGPFVMGDLEVSPAELRARRGGETYELSPRDVSILVLFHQSRGQVLDRGTIFNKCWGDDYMPNSRSLDQHISQLRKRIEADPKDPQLIRTVHGAGYRYDG
ncbi:MAG: response regulator transcription factor [Pirellulaceae bacterium]|jgi:DNA-binding response OmpR family regulator|nr:response regulator transcription factor [Pirellulaceae bacterium]MDP7016244.1 response regulator transcription factor [Pirellulaceae bacterium]